MATLKEESPGPGQYYSYEKFSTLNVKSKDLRHQFFSSTEDRFKGSLFNQDESSPTRVGPGAYEMKSAFEFEKRRHDSPKYVRNLKRIFDVPKDSKLMPGPGSYKHTDVSFKY